ncbi:3-dehydroquinate synthase [Flavihumibacter profundi]|uniref:3-dehydroquinate synthase n=1 Tax=Flavihumibacter profundi TaxID=2716883 RepID=UPI001CC62858|nr:3-dehydroquinate synthase [Flavihumibacter profundi]MBZ5856392.1 3-dehydroquinate synthase [Flavihumibacter profundi]
MDYIEQEFSVRFDYKVYFTSALFDLSNTLVNDFLKQKNTARNQKIFFVIDQNVANAHPHLAGQISAYFKKYDTVQLIEDILVTPGGEESKNDLSLFDKILDAVNSYKIDRHSYIAAIGGGSVLDVAGYAAAVSHRGIRHIRIPTTTLSQNDSGVGVKNSINYFNKKNFLGTFAPPVAVFNDDRFLPTQSARDWRSGISEAIKVALIKDAVFFDWIESHAGQLVARDLPTMNYLVRRCAELHLDHIAGGDPFEMGSSRPLDFGHWSAHKLEQLTDFEVLHGEAVAMGIALDTMYSSVSGRLPAGKAERVIRLLILLGFDISHPFMQIDENSPVLLGLNEFREHLGGRLTIMLLRDIGRGEEVHEIDTDLLSEASRKITAYAASKAFTV